MELSTIRSWILSFTLDLHQSVSRYIKPCSDIGSAQMLLSETIIWYIQDFASK